MPGTDSPSFAAYLFAIAAGQSLLIGAMLIASPQRGQRAVAYLAAILWVFAGLFGVVLANEHSAPAWARHLDLPLGLALAPLLVLHAEAAMGRRQGPLYLDLLWLSPVLPGLARVAGLALDAAALRNVMLLMLAAAVAWSLIAVTGFVRRYEDEYAGGGPARLHWLRNVHLLLALIVVAGLVQHGIESSGPSTLNSALIVAIPLGFVALNGYIALSLTRVRQVDVRAVSRRPLRGRDNIGKSELAALQERLEAAMRERHLYRDPALQLRRLSEATGIAERQVTEAIRRGLARNFYDYVNGYRIRDAEARLADPAASVTEVMLECGFNSKSSFYSEFRRRTGRAPAQPAPGPNFQTKPKDGKRGR